MTRSVWKGPFVDGYLLKKADASRSSGRHEIIKMWSRRSTILPQFVGLTFGVYNGQKHIPVSVTEEMVGHKFGEFAPTRTFHGHSADRKAEARAGSSSRTRVRQEDDNGQARTRESALGKRSQGGRPAAADLTAEAQLVAGLIRGKKVSSALADLEFSRKRIARDVRKCLESAIANAENNHDLDVDDLVVAEAYVGKALVMKRFHARGRGRAGGILKPFSNLTIVVREVEAGA